VHTFTFVSDGNTPSLSPRFSKKRKSEAPTARDEERASAVFSLERKVAEIEHVLKGDLLKSSSHLQAS
jgi:hypothetical protein